MLSAANPPEADSFATARGRVQNAPAPDWTDDCPYNSEFKSEKESPVTCLLFDTQIHAERHEAFVHQIVRLETMEAVQHWSQWRLQFEPKSQLVSMHYIKVRRGDVEVDQSNVEKAHLLQREEGLERFVIHGWFTLLVVLEDVRPGDILDFAYTIQSENRVFPEHGTYFFTPPRGLSTGKYRYTVRFDPARQRKWTASSAALVPLESVKEALTYWEWRGENYTNPKPEVNTPPWHISYLWIQTSDFPNWAMVAAGLAKEWATEGTEEALLDITREIQNGESDLAVRIDKAVQFVQDEFRYLSVNLEFGGQVPTPPETVARRRFGDCKDLSFFLAKILNQLGAKARPVLVHTFLRKSIADFLPAPSHFNHVVVEFEAEGHRRWVDPTLKEQGGGVFNRVIPNYALGLPIDADATGLVAQPELEQSHLYDLREHILLDTTGAVSLMAVTQRAEGSQADIFRFQFKKSQEEMARQRLQAIIQRFGNATRVGSMQHQDDRAGNRFIITEIFEIKFLLAGHPNPKMCRVNLPSNWLARVLLMPEKKERHTPFSLPYPCRIHYVAEVESRALLKMNLNEPRFYTGNLLVHFIKTSKGGNGRYSMDCSLVTHAEFVPAQSIQEHADVVEKIRRACCRELRIERGNSRPAQKPDFGQLPSTFDNSEAQVAEPKPSAAAPIMQTITTSPHRRRKRAKVPRVFILIIGLAVSYILLLILLKWLAPVH